MSEVVLVQRALPADSLARRLGFGQVAATTPPSVSKWALIGAAVGAALGFGGAKLLGSSVLPAVGGGAITGGIGGYIAAKSKANAPASSSAAVAAASGGQQSFQVILSPGTMAGISLSLSQGGGLVQFILPDGATGTINLLSSDSTTVQTSGMASPTNAVAKKVGTATLAAAWQDASGAAQTSSIPVTVTA